MAEKVRIAVSSDTGIAWPQRCPRCGRKDNLVYRESRVLSETFGYNTRPSWVRGNNPLANLEVNQRVAAFSIPTCQAHAFANEWGGKILERGLAMWLFRGSIYVSLGLLAVVLFQVSTGALTIQRILHGPWAFPCFLLWGVAGAFIILWARRGACVRPVILDPDCDVAVLRFSDDDYASDFKIANARAVSRAYAEDPPFFMRASFWKLTLVLGLLLYLAHKILQPA